MHQQFPPEIVDEILERLPTKSLVSFRCVSKLWTKIIKDPYLAHKQLHRIQGGLTEDLKMPCFILEDENNIPFTSKISKEAIEITPPRHYFFTCSCNGLYCFIPLFESDPLYHTVLYNPLRQETLKLPLFPGYSKFSLMTCGLGFDAKSNLYKIICFPLMEPASKAELHILGQKSWKQIELPAHLQGTVNWRALSVNGTIHWCVCKPDDSIVILGFDAEIEQFRSIDPPPGCTSFPFIEFQGFFAIPVKSCDSVKIWVLIKGEWNVGCTIPTSDLTSCLGVPYTDLWVAGRWKNEVVVWGEGINAHVSYDIRTKTVTKPIRRGIIHEVSIYQLSLIPLSQSMDQSLV